MRSFKTKFGRYMDLQLIVFEMMYTLNIEFANFYKYKPCKHVLQI